MGHVETNSVAWTDELRRSRGRDSRLETTRAADRYASPIETEVSPPEVTTAQDVNSDDRSSDRMIDALVSAGVDVFFGVPGGPIIHVFDAILCHPKAKLIESRQETYATFEAMGYWRATGKVPAVVITAGPGATNVVTGVVAAHLERVPIVIICGDVAWSTTGGVLLQALGPEGVGIENMLAHVTRATVRMANASSAANQIIAALNAATEPRNPGPALAIMPLDLSAQPAPAARHVRQRVEVSSRIDEEVLLEVGKLLVGATRPLIVVGGACSPYAREIQRLVEALRIPFMTTPRGKGIITEEHPFSLRNGGMAGSWWARRYTAGGVDAALALGTDLDDVSVGPTPPVGPGGQLIHVDTNSAVFNRNHPTTIGITCDVGSFVRDLHAVVARLDLRSKAGMVALRGARERSPFDLEGFHTIDDTKVAPAQVIQDLQAAVGPDARFVTDIGEHMLFALHYVTARDPGSFVIHLGLGSMASGICSAIGLALGDRSRRVVCVCGDGGMHMAGHELLVAQKQRLPIVYAVFNDARYNMVYHGYKQICNHEAPWDTTTIDFVMWAKSLGLPAARIDRAGQITRQLVDELTGDGLPGVLDIRIDPDVRLQGAGRVEAIQRMSGAPPSRRGLPSVAQGAPAAQGPSTTRGAPSDRSDD